MLDLAEYLKEGTPLTVIAIVVLYNLVMKALTQYHERKKARDEAERQERLIDLTAKLAAALKEIEYLKTLRRDK